VRFRCCVLLVVWVFLLFVCLFVFSYFISPAFKHSLRQPWGSQGNCLLVGVEDGEYPPSRSHAETATPRLCGDAGGGRAGNTVPRGNPACLRGKTRTKQTTPPRIWSDAGHNFSLPVYTPVSPRLFILQFFLAYLHSNFPSPIYALRTVCKETNKRQTGESEKLFSRSWLVRKTWCNATLAPNLLPRHSPRRRPVRAARTSMVRAALSATQIFLGCPKHPRDEDGLTPAAAQSHLKLRSCKTCGGLCGAAELFFVGLGKAGVRSAVCSGFLNHFHSRLSPLQPEVPSTPWAAGRRSRTGTAASR